MKFVKMKRDDRLADVHPEEVKNYQRGGWAIAEQPKDEAPKRRGRPSLKSMLDN